MTTGNDIDSFVRAHARTLGGPLVVSPNVLQAMKRNMADIGALKREGCLLVTSPMEVRHIPAVVSASKGDDGVWRVP